VRSVGGARFDLAADLLSDVGSALTRARFKIGVDRGEVLAAHRTRGLVDANGEALLAIGSLEVEPAERKDGGVIAERAVGGTGASSRTKGDGGKGRDADLHLPSPTNFFRHLPCGCAPFRRMEKEQQYLKQMAKQKIPHLVNEVQDLQWPIALFKENRGY